MDRKTRTFMKLASIAVLAALWVVPSQATTIAVSNWDNPLDGVDGWTFINETFFIRLQSLFVHVRNVFEKPFPSFLASELTSERVIPRTSLIRRIEVTNHSAFIDEKNFSRRSSSVSLLARKLLIKSTK